MIMPFIDQIKLMSKNITEAHSIYNYQYYIFKKLITV